MSHIVTVETQVRDPAAVRSACQRLQLPPPRQGTFKLFSSQVAGLGIELPQWRYPVVCQTETGQLHYDNYDGRWGDPRHLEKFLQRYAVEKATLEARRQGHTCTETQLSDGSIKLSIQVGGAV